MEACPCCGGTGQCKVSMMGFDCWWFTKCVDCAGSGKVWGSYAYRLRAIMAKRRARGFPPVPPEGLRPR